MPGRGGMRGGPFSDLTEEEKKSVPKVTKDLLKRIFSYIEPYKGRLALVFVCIIISASMKLLPSILTGNIIDEGLIGRSIPKLILYILLSLLVTFAANIIGIVESHLNTWIAQHISFDMRNQMYKHLQRMSQRFFTTNSQGDIITRMTSDISGVERVVTNTFTNIISNVITLVIAVIAMFQKNWILALIGMVIIPLFALPTRSAGKKRWSITRQSQEFNDNMNEILNETMSVSGQLLVKLFNKEGYEYGKYRQLNKQMIDLNIKENLAGRWFFVIMSTFTKIGPMLIYFVGGLLMMKTDSSLTVGDITVMVSLLSQMYMPVNSLLNIQVEWLRSMALFSRIFEYYDLPVEIKNKENALKPSSFKGDIRFNDVSFSYDGENDILKHIDLEIKAGDCLAVVGPSGSGKSTLINLLPRLYDVTGGSVTIDGNDVRDIDLSFLRGGIGLVSQDTYLFNGTIRENLLYAKPNATEEELREVCRKANILDLIESSPDGMETMVGNRGLKLSGGEKQRLSIARVLLKDPDIVIFDEATSALDSINERKIQDAIDPIVEERTSILIAHRLSTILAADEIAVLKDGRIVERGQHEDLLKLNGVYAELYNTQFKIKQ